MKKLSVCEPPDSPPPHAASPNAQKVVITAATNRRPGPLPTGGQLPQCLCDKPLARTEAVHAVEVTAMGVPEHLPVGGGRALLAREVQRDHMARAAAEREDAVAGVEQLEPLAE